MSNEKKTNKTTENTLHAYNIKKELLEKILMNEPLVAPLIMDEFKRLRSFGNSALEDEFIKSTVSYLEGLPKSFFLVKRQIEELERNRFAKFVNSGRNVKTSFRIKEGLHSDRLTARMEIFKELAIEVNEKKKTVREACLKYFKTHREKCIQLKLNSEESLRKAYQRNTKTLSLSLIDSSNPDEVRRNEEISNALSKWLNDPNQFQESK